MSMSTGVRRVVAATRGLGWIVVVVTIALAVTTPWAWWIFASGGAMAAAAIFGIAWVIDGFATR